MPSGSWYLKVQKYEALHLAHAVAQYIDIPLTDMDDKRKSALRQLHIEYLKGMHSEDASQDVTPERMLRILDL